MRIFLIFFLAVLYMAAGALPANATPYYATIATSEANIRTGPSVRYPIQWVYKKHGWPVKVTATFENWRKIDDVYGEVGWVHESLLSGSRSAVINGEEGVKEIYRLPMASSAHVAMAEKGVIVNLTECKNGWCKVSVSGAKGWIESKYLWGTDSNEDYSN